MGAFTRLFTLSNGRTSASTTRGGLVNSNFCNSASNTSGNTSKLQTYSTFGYVEPLIGPVGVGASVTVTSTHDVLVSGIVGTAGPVVSSGISAPGQNVTDYLSGPGISVNLPMGYGVTSGTPLQNSMITPTFNSFGSTISASGSYTTSVGSLYCSAVDTVNAAAAGLSSAYSGFTSAVDNIYNQAAQFGSGGAGSSYKHYSVDAH